MEKTLNRAILKICSAKKPESYMKSEDMKKVINYVLKDSKRADDDIWGSIGTYGKSKEDIIKDLKKIKRLYDKTDDLQLKHLVLSWGSKPDIPRKNLRKLIKHTLMFWGIDYQLVYAVHEDKLPDGWHMHIVINSVANNGKKIQITGKNLAQFREAFNIIWNPYGYELRVERHK